MICKQSALPLSYARIAPSELVALQLQSLLSSVGNHPDLMIFISIYMSSIPRAVEAPGAIRFLIVCGGFGVRMTTRGIEPATKFHCIGMIWKQSAFPLSYARIAL